MVAVAGAALTEAVTVAAGAGTEVAGGARTAEGAVAAGMAESAVPAAVALLLAAAKGKAAGSPQKGTLVARNCSACGLNPGDSGDKSPAAKGASALPAAMAGLAGLCAASLSEMMFWLLVVALLAGAWNGILAAQRTSQDRRGLCCRSAWRFGTNA